MFPGNAPSLQRHFRLTGLEAVHCIADERQETTDLLGWEQSHDLLSQGERKFAAYFQEADPVERVQCKALLLLRAALLSVIAPNPSSARAPEWSELRHDFDLLSEEIVRGPAFGRITEAERVAMWTHLLTLDLD